MMYGWIMKTPLGLLSLVEKEERLWAVSWRVELEATQKHTPLLQNAEAQIEAYFAKQRKTFALPLAARGTGFQNDVWAQVANVPYGQVISYQEVARRLGRPQAARAVGQAMGSNPFTLIIPCHRIVRSDGALGGYAYGLERKRALLTLESGA